MPELTLLVNHNLGTEEATRRIQDAVLELRRRNTYALSGIQESWMGSSGSFSCRMMGMSIEGTVDVDPAQVKLKGRFPWAALCFKKKAEHDIACKARRLLS